MAFFKVNFNIKLGWWLLDSALAAPKPRQSKSGILSSKYVILSKREELINIEFKRCLYKRSYHEIQQLSESHGELY
jgi:hypothetical protein